MQRLRVVDSPGFGQGDGGGNSGRAQGADFQIMHREGSAGGVVLSVDESGGVDELEVLVVGVGRVIQPVTT